MKKPLLLLMSLLLLVFSANSQNSNPNAPIFKFVEEVHDFGNIIEGPEAQIDFVFTNVGKEPLIIMQANASCGCTTPDWTKEPVKPGQKGSIKVKYTTKDRVGSFNKTVFIRSNAYSDKERYEIQIKGNVIAASNTDKSIKINPSIQNAKN
ncbi:MAG TPA: DUF1573 domain-containing protein [Chitinophagaceae bacterium]|nr:MAG: OmpA/MotB domain-containing protein [Bacteroidetes bacterium OLB11]HMN33104.1 DUF1573 domain-containing protein [Chitinophagaceae bacterium]